MAQEDVVDEVVSPRPAGSGLSARRIINETIDADSGEARVQAEGILADEIPADGVRTVRKLKESTQKLIDKLANTTTAPAPAAEEVVEDTAEGGDSEAADPDDEGLLDEEAAAPEGEAAAAEETKPEETKPEEPKPDNQWQDYATRLEASNRQLLAELEAARQRPRDPETPANLKTLAEAESAYVDNPVAALRKFLAVVLDVPPDSKQVDAELSGLYTDLTSQELAVPLDGSHKATRDAAMARLALARDKRERKAASEAPKVEATDDTEAKNFEQAATFIDNRLRVARDGGKSYADDFPLLTQFAETFDGLKPEKLIARVIQRELSVGTLDPSFDSDNLIKAAAQLVENHYAALADKLSKAKPPKTDTTTSGDPKKTATAAPASKEQRQSTGTRTITNATASVAPATSPKPKPQSAKELPKFKNDKERREYLLRKYFPNG